MMKDCIFCNVDKSRMIYEDNYWFAIYDNFPVNPGHVLLIPKRHVSEYWELNAYEAGLIYHIVKDFIVPKIKNEFNPDGFNIGINQGEAAGQTISHLHIHIIPRYTGDTQSPKGGVRGVIPEKMSY